MEKFHLALPELEKLVVLHPKDVALWTQLGHLYALLNMTAQSKTAFDKVDELSK